MTTWGKMRTLEHKAHTGSKDKVLEWSLCGSQEGLPPKVGISKDHNPCCPPFSL